MMEKVLHISKYYYPYIGGTESVCQDIVDGLVNYENRVICFNDKLWKSNVLKVRGVDVIKVRCFAKIASQSLSIVYYLKLKNIIKYWKPSVIHFHHPNPLIAFYLLKLIPDNVKLLVHWHLDITKQKFIYGIIKGSEEKLLQRADRIIVTSPNYRDSSLSLRPFLNKVEVLPNGININRLNKSPNDEIYIRNLKNRYNNRKLVFFVGRHVEYKGLKYLIEAEKYIQTDCHIVIAGRGPLSKKLSSMVNSQRITFVGHLSSDELRCYLFASDIFAFPSITKNEAFGLALAEAMYCECVPVTFNIEGSGVNWVSINGITGLEVENSNSKQFAGAIDKLLINEDLKLRYAKASKLRIIENFTIEKEQEGVNRIYQEL